MDVKFSKNMYLFLIMNAATIPMAYGLEGRISGFNRVCYDPDFEDNRHSHYLQDRTLNTADDRIGPKDKTFQELSKIESQSNRSRNYTITIGDKQFNETLGNLEELYQLGKCYEKGDGVTINLQKALEYYYLAAMQGNPNAQLQLGWQYYNGVGVNQDQNIAVKYFKLAARQGSIGALYNLGHACYYGNGVPQDLQKAFDYYKQSADKGDDYAQYALGNSYRDGKGVTKDLVKAFEYYKLAAKQGNSDAQYEVGMCYMNGNGVTQYLSKSVKYYKLAADQGHPNAQSNLGYAYYYGKGVPQDLKISFDYYKQSADQGYAPAQYNVGNGYWSGSGVPQDLSKAFDYIQLAANQGNLYALYSLGHMYESGIGVVQDFDKAVEFYNLSANQGNEKAKLKLDELQRKKTDDSAIPVEGNASQIEPKSKIRKSPNSEKSRDKKQNNPEKKTDKGKEEMKAPAPLETHPKKKSETFFEKAKNLFTPASRAETAPGVDVKKEERRAHKESSAQDKVKKEKSRWNDTVGKSREDKSAAREKRQMVKRQSELNLQNPKNKSTGENRDEKTIEESKIKALDGVLSSRDVKNHSQVELNKKAIIETLTGLAEQKIIEIPLQKYRDKLRATKIGKNVGPNPPSLTVHLHNHNLAWEEQLRVRSHFLDFIAQCGLDPANYIKQVEKATNTPDHKSIEEKDKGN